MDYSKDYNNSPDEDLEERDAKGMLAKENAEENRHEMEKEYEREMIDILNGGGITMINDPTNEEELEEAREVYELKKLMSKYADRVVGLLKELNDEHIKNAQELEKPTFKVTNIGG